MRYLLLFVAMIALHQDVWLWRDGRALFGILPVGLAYHVAYTVFAAVVLWLLVRHDWPRDLEDS
jgi:hypothetical protein